VQSGAPVSIERPRGRLNRLWSSPASPWPDHDTPDSRGPDGIVDGGESITEKCPALIGLFYGGKARTLGDGTHLFRTQLVDKGVDNCRREHKQGKVSGVDHA
jgi:hypothetical protein